jgi:hypothetical protein
MLSRTNQLPEMDCQCPECGLNVRGAAGHIVHPSAASLALCKHQPWHECPKLNLEKLRRSARELTSWAL